MNKWKRAAFIFGVPVAVILLSAQTGPTVFTPRLTVNPGPLTVTTGLTTVEDITINGTCTGCTVTPPGGANSQVQYNDGGVFGGDVAFTWNEGTSTLTATNLSATAATLATALPVASGGTGVTTSTGTGSTVRSASPTLTGTTTVADLTISGTCTGCGATPAGGSNTQVQFNNSGAFAGDAGLTYISGTDTLTATNLTSTAITATTLNSVAPANFARIDASNVPTSNNTFNLGSTTVKWGTVYMNELSDGASASGSMIQSTGTTVILTGGSGWTTGALRTAGATRISYSASDIDLNATTVQANGSNICTANGTNCPAGSSTIESPTCNGFSSTTACGLRWTDLGAQVCVNVSVAGTSNATTFTMTGFDMPDPVYTPNNASPMHAVDNGVSAITLTTVSSTGQTVTFTYGATFLTNGFTASGSKGASGSFCYGITP